MCPGAGRPGRGHIDRCDRRAVAKEQCRARQSDGHPCWYGGRHRFCTPYTYLHVRTRGRTYSDGSRVGLPYSPRMEHDHRPTVSSEPETVRDAGEILARALVDEAAADLARARYRTEPMAALPPDEQISPLLVPGERVVAIRRSALLERRQPMPGARATCGLAGTLYVTSRRLVLVGLASLSFGLGAIQEVILSGDRLLVVLRDGQGLTLEVRQSRLLRVELAAARAAAQTGGERLAEDQSPGP